MIILGLETSRNPASVAVFKEGAFSVCTEFQHHMNLLRMLSGKINAVLSKAGVKPAELLAVAVSLGPGSYTGLRIGMAAAKGLSFGLGIPLVGVSTFAAAVYGCPKGVYTVVAPKARERVFSAVIESGQWRTLSGAEETGLSAVVNSAQGTDGLVVLGPREFRLAVEASVGEAVLVREARHSAESICRLGAAKLADAGPESPTIGPEYLAPTYVGIY